jgi:L-ascorbate metabolism protein UlaG (beta-lactamase superfamily)
MRWAGFLFSLILLLLASCSNSPHYSPVKKHHTADGFRNLYPHPPKGSFWKWQWDRLRHGVPPNPEGGYHFATVAPDVDFLKANRTQDTLTWLGHATFLLQVGGVNILTDPHLTKRASPLSFAGPARYVEPPLSFEQLPHIDIVVISHSHYDHLDYRTVQRLAAQLNGAPRFFVGLGLKQWAADNGIGNVTELDWGESAAERGITLHFVPVQHWSSRTPWDRNRTLWGAWVLEHRGRKYFFGGDFGYSQDLADAGRKFGGFDLAMIPVGAYEPRWFMKTNHVNPEEAVQAHRDLNSRHSVGMHWGTFRLTDETLDEPPARLMHALAEAGIAPQEFFLMKHGETRPLAALFAQDETGKRSAAAR